MMPTLRRRGRGTGLTLLFLMLLLLVLEAAGGQAVFAAAPPRVALGDPVQAPQTARILRQVALSYAPGMSANERDRDFLQKIALAKRLLGVTRLVDLRHQALNLLAGREPSWEYLRRRRFPGGERVGVVLTAPVWAPARARRVPTYSGFEKTWQAVAYGAHRPSGYVWFAARIAEINDKARYRPERIQFEVNSRFAPLAALLLEYVFREGWYEPEKRVPLMVVRGAEDTYAASAYTGPVEAECLSFPDDWGDSLDARVVRGRYRSLAEIYHGRHAKGSNHRLGLALDLNDFNYQGVVDGPPNPISRAARQFNRDAMHRLDARHLPAWVFRTGKWLGLRLPQEWIYQGLHTDWQHLDVGTSKVRKTD
ncbi:MAG: hypothetical protein FJ128_07345 [Deltaproteobacteria bacterium]|nr:hypothetical protein [Deltaproteobacteria bacterium]